MSRLPEPRIPPAPGPLLQAAKAILRPLVRVLIARGITLPVVVAALKEVFVDVARRDFRLGGREPSDSRITVLTGVHRKDIRAIRDSARPLSRPREAAIPATVVGRWLALPGATVPTGAPPPLPRIAPPGTPSFEALVAAVSKDVRPRTVLDELIRLRVAALDPVADTVRLLDEAFVPGADADAMLDFFERNVADHLSAAAANLLAGPGDPRLLERAVYYNNLPADAVDRIEAEARTLALAALRHLNGLALEAQAASTDATDGAPQRFRFGVYFHREPVAPPGPESGP